VRAWVVVIALAACFSKPPRPGGQADAALDANGTGDVNPNTPYNYVFVTSTAYFVYKFGGVAGADAACNTAATQVGLPGTYVAWLSTASMNAIDRLQNSRGWIRPDGLPFLDAASDIVNGKMYYPPDIDETDNYVGVGQPVATGTLDNGTDAVGADCAGFTDMNAPIRFGLADSGAVTWTNEGSQSSCQTAMRLYCFGVGHEAALTPAIAPGPRAFVSTVTSVTGGQAAMDTTCMTEASGHGIGGRFKAFVATTQASAMTHVGGTPAMPWVRTDGIPVTSDFVTFTAPLDLTGAGLYVRTNVATGAMMPTIMSPGGAENCSDWAAGTTTDFGLSDRAMYRAFYGGNPLSCVNPQSVYCVETP
jgi:hypothetical protein